MVLSKLTLAKKMIYTMREQIPHLFIAIFFLLHAGYNIINAMVLNAVENYLIKWYNNNMEKTYILLVYTNYIKNKTY